MTTRRFARTASLALVAGFLVAGLWPLGFSPRNRVSWVSDGRGLYFDGFKKPWKLSVGGLAYSASAPGTPHVRDAAKGSLTILIQLRPAREKAGKIARIVSFSDASGEEALYLGQYRQDAIMRWLVPKPGGGTTIREVGSGRTLFQTKTGWLAITSDQNETVIYANGRKAKSFPGTALLDGRRSIWDYRIALGNTIHAESQWGGAILDLALYDRALSEDAIFEAWRNSPDRIGESELVRDGLMAAYSFEKGTGARVPDLSGHGNDILVPERLRINNKLLDWPDLESQSALGLAKDVISNIFGFVPLGFFLLLWLDDGRRWFRRHPYLFVVAAGAVLSLAIEITQAFMPARDSSLRDLTANILGTALGVSVYHLYSRFRSRRISKS